MLLVFVLIFWLSLDIFSQVSLTVQRGTTKLASNWSCSIFPFSFDSVVQGELFFSFLALGAQLVLLSYIGVSFL